MGTELTVFNEFETGLVLLEESNAEKEFPATPEGLADRRAWYKKLRKGTNALDKLRKDAGADYLRLGREVNAEAKTIQVRLDVMELPHKIILDTEDAKIRKEIDDLAAKAEAESAAKEAKRIADLEEREAKAQAIIDKAEQVERDAKAALEAAELAKKIEADKLAAVEEAKQQAAQDLFDTAAKVEQDKVDAAAKVKADADRASQDAENKLQEAIAEEQQKAHQKENDRIAAELVKQNETARLAKIEADRVADVEHQTKIEDEIRKALFHFIGSNSVLARNIIAAMKDGQIPHIEIKY